MTTLRPHEIDMDATQVIGRVPETDSEKTGPIDLARLRSQPDASDSISTPTTEPHGNDAEPTSGTELLPLGETEWFSGIPHDKYRDPATGDEVYLRRNMSTPGVPEPKRVMSVQADYFDNDHVQGVLTFRGHKDQVAGLIPRALATDSAIAPPALPPVPPVLYPPSFIPTQFGYAQPSEPFSEIPLYAPVPAGGLPRATITSDTSPAESVSSQVEALQRLLNQDQAQVPVPRRASQERVARLVRNQGFRRWSYFVVGLCIVADIVPAVGTTLVSDTGFKQNLNPAHSVHVYKEGADTIMGIFG